MNTKSFSAASYCADNLRRGCGNTCKCVSCDVAALCYAVLPVASLDGRKGGLRAVARGAVRVSRTKVRFRVGAVVGSILGGRGGAVTLCWCCAFGDAV